MFEAVEDVETLQLCVHTWPHPRTEEVSKRHYYRKLKVLVSVILYHTMIQYTFWACSGASRCSAASPQGDTRGMFDHRPDFWVVFAPHARARVGHMPGGI